MQKYNHTVLQLFHHTQHHGRLDESLQQVYVAQAGSANNEEALKLFLHIENDCIVQARFLAKGCVALIAGSEWLCQHVNGKALHEVAALSATQILEALKLTTLKAHVAQLIFAAFNRIMENVK